MCEEGDRARTRELLGLIADRDVVAIAETEAFEELAALEDYRSIGPLTALVADNRWPDAVREEASKVLAGVDDTTTSEARRAWWGSGDPVLMRHALRLMGRAEADIVVAVAGDDGHPMQEIALGDMAWGFDEPGFADVPIRALRHREAAVRVQAADVLLWDEPVAAEEGLLEAAHDRSPEVAAEALNTLRYYMTQRVLVAVGELRDSDSVEVREAATVAFAELHVEFESAATSGEPGSVALLREWMRPVRSLVEWPDAIAVPEPGTSSPVPPKAPLPERDLLNLLDDADAFGPTAQLAMRVNNWSAYDTATRQRLTTRLVAHPDPIVRACATTVLAKWSGTDELLQLTRDRSADVRKSAMYNLAFVPPNAAVAECAWQYLATAAGTTAYEALRTYLAHTPGDPLDQLVDLARFDRREAIRSDALNHLSKLHADKEIRALTPLLAEAPGVTWAVHLALLDGIRELGLPVPPLADLTAVDNLHLQCCLAQLLARD